MAGGLGRGARPGGDADAGSDRPVPAGTEDHVVDVMGPGAPGWSRPRPGLVDLDLPVLVEAPGDLGREHVLGGVEPQVARVRGNGVVDDEQDAAGRDRREQRPLRIAARSPAQRRVLGRDEIERPGRQRRLDQAGVHPGGGDARARCVPLRPAQRDTGDIQAGDLPSPPGEPHDVRALPAADVQGPAGREVGDLRHQGPVRGTAPDRGVAVALVPGVAVTRCRVPVDLPVPVVVVLVVRGRREGSHMPSLPPPPVRRLPPCRFGNPPRTVPAGFPCPDGSQNVGGDQLTQLPSADPAERLDDPPARDEQVRDAVAHLAGIHRAELDQGAVGGVDLPRDRTDSCRPPLEPGRPVGGGTPARWSGRGSIRQARRGEHPSGAARADADVSAQTGATAATGPIDGSRGCLVLSGVPGAGKTTVADLVAGHLPRAAVPDGDAVARMVRSGWVGPVDEPADQARAQLMLRARNVCLLAGSFAAAGFFPVIDHVVADAAMLEAMLGWLEPAPVWFVTLAPSLATARARNAARPEQERIAYDIAGLHADLERDLRGRGWWFDTSSLDAPTTVARLIAEAPTRAAVPRR